MVRAHCCGISRAPHSHHHHHHHCVWFVCGGGIRAVATIRIHWALAIVYLAWSLPFWIHAIRKQIAFDRSANCWKCTNFWFDKSQASVPATPATPTTAAAPEKHNYGTAYGSHLRFGLSPPCVPPRPVGNGAIASDHWFSALWLSIAYAAVVKLLVYFYVQTSFNKVGQAMKNTTILQKDQRERERATKKKSTATQYYTHEKKNDIDDDDDDVYYNDDPQCCWMACFFFT